MSKLNNLENHLIDNPKKNTGKNTLLQFFIGIFMVGIGIFMVFQNTYVTMNWVSWHLGAFSVPTGVVSIPLFIGIGLLFYNSKSIINWIVAILGFLIILVTIIMSVSIIFKTTSLYVYVIMFGLIAAGVALLLKSLFINK